MVRCVLLVACGVLEMFVEMGLLFDVCCWLFVVGLAVCCSLRVCAVVCDLLFLLCVFVVRRCLCFVVWYCFVVCRWWLFVA